MESFAVTFFAITGRLLKQSERFKRLTYTEQNSLLSADDTSAGRFGRLRLLRDDNEAFLAKTKQEFQCLTCKAGKEGGWEMLIHNVLYGAGCPICRHSSALANEMAERFPSHRLLVIAPPFGPPVSAESSYQLFPFPCELPDDFGWQPERLTRNSIAAALRESRRPSEKVERYYEDSVTAYKEFTECFPNGSIRYKGTKAPGTTSPGPFFEIQTETRLMRSPVSDQYMSLPGLLKICCRERHDQTYDKKLKATAALHGAEILGYEQHPARGLMIKYKNRAGDIRTDTPQRAQEFCWGQTWIRKAEKLTATIMRELFPSETWVFNKRYNDFLRYTSPTGKVSVLELDGYCPSHRIAFEYQGIQHFMTLTDTKEARQRLEEIQQRDIFKVDQCREVDISLVVVPNMDLDPEVFLQTITAILLSLDRRPTNPVPDVQNIWAIWNLACQNPLAKFQAKVVEKLGKHRLIGPKKEQITRNTVVIYECGICKTRNEVGSRSLADGAVRSYCISCKGLQTGNARSQKRLDMWEEELGFSHHFIENLRTTPAESKYFQFLCGQNHATDIYHPEHAKRHISNGVFECPTCRGELLGVSANQVAVQAQYRRAFNDNIKSLGLTIIEELPHQEGQMAAKVICADGQHTFEVRKSDLRRFERDFFNDRSIIPSACLRCCYPGVTVSPGDMLMGTLFHRLASLRGMYLKISYVTGFDPEGWNDERFNCGEMLPDGSPHPDFSISWRNLQSAGKARPFTHLCNACGVASGQVGNRGKSLRDLEAIMTLLRHELHMHKPTSAPFSPPTVTYHEGPIDPHTQVVSTTKTRLVFWCGAMNHEPVIATKDSYFNRAPTKGAGFCKKCVETAGLKKAPLPAAEEGSIRQLRPCTLRDRTKNAGRKI